MAYVFRGGIFFTSDKKTGSGKIERLVPTGTLFIPTETGCELAVSFGDRVLRGQTIARGCKGVASVHAPVSGKVTGIEAVDGKSCIVIECDGVDEISPEVSKMKKKLADCSSEEITMKIDLSGIVDVTGEPVSEKLSRVFGHVRTCIINCAECEPYISSDGRIAAEKASAVVNGLKILLRALGIRHGVIAIPEGSVEATKKIGGMVKNSKMISMSVCRAKYPAGSERRLVYTVTGRELRPGADPVELGCVVFGVGACVAVYEAFVGGMPQVTSVVTVSGDCVVRPVNIEVPIGVKFSELVRFAGGVKSDPEIILDGGPLSGRTTTLDDVVCKTTRALLLCSDRMKDKYSEPPVCIRCGRCVSVCPERLMPNYIYNYLRDGKNKEAIASGALACVGCGSCSYICPGKAPITELIADFQIKFRNNKSARKEAEADS